MEVLHGFWEVLASKIPIIAAFYVIVLVLIMLDLWSGIRKAKLKGDYAGFFKPRKKKKRKGEEDGYISSYGLQRTVNKIARYGNMLFAITAIDIMQMLAVFYMRQKDAISFIPLIPLFTFLAAFFVCVIEVKSIYEKAEQKDKAKSAEAARILGELLRVSQAKDAVETVLSKIEERGNFEQDKNTKQ